LGGLSRNRLSLEDGSALNWFQGSGGVAVLFIAPGNEGRSTPIGGSVDETLKLPQVQDIRAARVLSL